MEKTPHNDFFTDNQAAVALGMTLRSLQNKIHRAKVSKTSPLPPYHMASARGRLWEKRALKSFLDLQYKDSDFVTGRMEKGNQAPPLGDLGASDASLKIPATVAKRIKPKNSLADAGPRRPGRPRKTPA